MQQKRIDELQVGDLVDLEDDPYADPDGTNESFRFEYQEVIDTERETPSCVVVYFVDHACGFPPDHKVTVAPSP